MKVVRDSKFRHVHGENTKQTYLDVRPSNKSTESTGIRGNSKFLAISWESGGGGTIAVNSISKFGRIPRDIPLITGHSGPILDFEFNPFNDNILASASEDLTVKLWQIPDEGLKAHMKDPLVTLEGHGKKVSFCTFNRSANNIIASAAFDMKLKIWNIEEQAEAFNVMMPDQVNCMKWNHMGSLIAASAKDKKLHIIDPRASKLVTDCKVHDGSKAIKVDWMSSSVAVDECNKLITTGFSQQAERQIGIWDMRKFSSEEKAEPLNLLVLDQGTGALYPHYDRDTGMLFVAGKGDANCRYFEMVPQDPFIHFISQYGSTVPQKGFDFLPKRCCDTTKHEIMKGLKLEAAAVQPVTFQVPRKSEAFQEDLFPDAPSGFPAMGPDEWIGGEDKEPATFSMKPGEDRSQAAAKAASAAPAVVSVKDLKKQLADAQARIKELEEENAKLKEQLAAKA